MQIELTDAAVTWFKNELELPENNKVLVFFVRYGGEFQLKQGFSPAFTVEPKEDVDIGYEQQYDDLNVVVAEKDLWYFEDDHIIVNVVDHEDEISYSKKITKIKRTCLHILMCTEPRKLYFGLAHLMLYEQVRFCYIY